MLRFSSGWKLLPAGSFNPIAVTAVPPGLAGRIADAFTGRAIGSYAPFLTCKAYEATPSQACSQASGLRPISPTQ